MVSSVEQVCANEWYHQMKMFGHVFLETEICGRCLPYTDDKHLFENIWEHSMYVDELTEDPCNFCEPADNAKSL